uniref:glycoside hydrolase family 11 protein n=1 Tax=Cellvibrio fontiphilus TaxID=1815559 RepID=UPI002B4BC3F3|nr:glycoside hydrolase family 11 protein [Cellvibrio fontiphilus]
MKFPLIGKSALAALFCSTLLGANTSQAQTLTNNATGTHNGFYYTFWKDSGDASMGLQAGGRYTSQWSNGTNNWVGGKGWNPGGPKVVNYSGSYNVDNSQNSYLALYGWTRSPLIEYYVIESYGSYNPASCSGGTDYGSFQSDGATYNVRRCQRVQQPSIEGTQTFYQYFSVRSPKKGFGKISGTITTANHFNFWASKGLNLGNHDYMVLATEGYQSRGSSDITVSEGTAGNTSSVASSMPPATGSSSSVANPGGVLVRARGVAGGEHINLRIGGTTVASWNLTTSFQDLVYSGTAAGDIQVQFDNDGGSRDVVVDYIRVNGETRQAEDMSYNTAFYTNGSCGGGGNSELMHCNGAIGFGFTYDCFSGNCSGGSTGGGANSSVASSVTSTASCAGYVGITFDDGPGSNTATLVNLLKQNNLTPVTWFVQGNNMNANPQLMAQLLSVGEVQNHSYSHPQLTNLGYQQIYDELNRTNQAIQNAGAPKPTLFRPPYGGVNSNINQAAQALGLRVITWDVDSQDWNGASAAAIANAANQLQNGQVILLHDASYNNTNAAIAQIAANLRAKGLCPGRINPATGRAVAPAVAPASSAPNIASSSSRSSTPVVSSSSAATNACQCNWWGTRYPLCTNTASGWGWENNRSCITTSTCNSQGVGGGGVVCN